MPQNDLLSKYQSNRNLYEAESADQAPYQSAENWEKSAINKKKNSVIYKKPPIYSKPVAKLEIGRLMLIKKCETKWCKITSGSYGGWILKNSLWGKIK